MRAWSILIVLVMALSVVGCAKKTASEQLQDDMKKTADKMKKDINNL